MTVISSIANSSFFFFFENDKFIIPLFKLTMVISKHEQYFSNPISFSFFFLFSFVNKESKRNGFGLDEFEQNKQHDGLQSSRLA